MITRRKKITLAKGIIGVISDTHGLMRPEALAALKDVELIIHGGDIGKLDVIQALSAIAPVCAIRGNNDRGVWAQKLPDRLHLQINGAKIQVIHNVHELDGNPEGTGTVAVISGHSHKPSIVTRDSVLFINPGSAGPRRFKLPVTVARLEILNGGMRSIIQDLL
jgi:putative phosphoesterase